MSNTKAHVLFNYQHHLQGTWRCLVWWTRLITDPEEFLAERTACPWPSQNFHSSFLWPVSWEGIHWAIWNYSHWALPCKYYYPVSLEAGFHGASSIHYPPIHSFINNDTLRNWVGPKRTESWSRPCSNLTLCNTVQFTRSFAVISVELRNSIFVSIMPSLSTVLYPMGLSAASLEPVSEDRLRQKQQLPRTK